MKFRQPNVVEYLVGVLFSARFSGQKSGTNEPAKLRDRAPFLKALREDFLPVEAYFRLAPWNTNPEQFVDASRLAVFFHHCGGSVLLSFHRDCRNRRRCEFFSTHVACVLSSRQCSRQLGSHTWWICNPPKVAS